LAFSLYRMFRRISVVITTMSARGWKLTSPVMSPTLSSPNRSCSSRSFWLLRAFSGVV